LYSSNVTVIFAIIITKQLTLSVTKPFNSSPASIWHRCEEMALQMLNARTYTRKEKREKGKRKGKRRERKEKSGRGKGSEIRR